MLQRSTRVRLGLSLFVVLLATVLVGCDSGPRIVPIHGKVLYKGEPLKFGSVMLQPEGGQPATGRIQPDGTFKMTTNSEGDGATVGPNKIRVTSYEAQDPNYKHSGQGEMPLGNSMIPEKFANYDTSGLTVTVNDGPNEELVIELPE